MKTQQFEAIELIQKPFKLMRFKDFIIANEYLNN
jgi:hypothetical protein